MVNSRGPGVIKDTVMANGGEVEEDNKEETVISGFVEKGEETNSGISGENDREAKKRKEVKKGRQMPKDGVNGEGDVIRLANSGEVEEDNKEETVVSGFEEREEETNNEVAGENEREAKKRKEVKKGKEMLKDGVNGEGDVIRSAIEERKPEKKRKNKKNDVLVGHENGGEVKKMKREKPKDNTEAHSKEKQKEIDDVLLAENENCEVLKSKKRKRESSKLATPESDEFPFDDGCLVQGKRFSKEEDELIKKAVDMYIEAKQLGDDGLDMILDCRSHPEVKDCWQVISTALPWRPHLSVYGRARKLYIRGDSKWTAEEVEFVRESYKKHGPNWKMMADKLGKYHIHVRNAFQRYKLFDLNKGKWSQDEYQRLFELVNQDLLTKVSEEKKSRHGMLKDNIRWEAISDKLGSRENAKCCIKWYSQLTSPMVAQGEWADVDDYRMLTVLFDLDASCEEEVDWDDLLGHRSGELCRKRWLQMSRHIGEHGNKSFSEQVDILSKRYCPDFAEVREALDARPVVD